MKKTMSKKQVTVEGMMTFGQLKTGERTLDFQCCEDVQAEAFRGDFYVQGMRDGNVYLEQKPRRPRNRALFREDNSSLSHGRNDRYYFVFTLPAAEADDLPRKLVDQASMIAGKFIKNVLMKGGQQR